MKMYRCNFPGCGKLLTQSGYCPSHQAMRPKPFSTATRPNEEFYKSQRWKVLRRQKINEHPYCYLCGITDGLQVHHTTPPRGNEDLFFNENNLVVVCENCHRIITAQEIRERQK